MVKFHSLMTVNITCNIGAIKWSTSLKSKWEHYQVQQLNQILRFEVGTEFYSRKDNVVHSWKQTQIYDIRMSVFFEHGSRTVGWVLQIF